MASTTTTTIKELRKALETAHDLVDAVERLLGQLDQDMEVPIPVGVGPFVCPPAQLPPPPRGNCGPA